eukprot:1572890-Pyramimonas_sp.AAC.1
MSPIIVLIISSNPIVFSPASSSSSSPSILFKGDSCLGNFRSPPTGVRMSCFLALVFSIVSAIAGGSE